MTIETREGQSNEQGNAVHPGEILREEFLVPLGLTAYRLARELDVPQQRISDLVACNRGITPDTALRLGRYFQGDADRGARFWMALQARYELDRALEQDDLAAALDSIAPREQR
jgi:addiction module HigA family antidote